MHRKRLTGRDVVAATHDQVATAARNRERTGTHRSAHSLAQVGQVVVVAVHKDQDIDQVTVYRRAGHRAVDRDAAQVGHVVEGQVQGVASSICDVGARGQLQGHQGHAIGVEVTRLHGVIEFQRIRTVAIGQGVGIERGEAQCGAFESQTNTRCSGHKHRFVALHHKAQNLSNGVGRIHRSRNRIDRGRGGVHRHGPRQIGGAGVARQVNVANTNALAGITARAQGERGA